MIPLEIVLPQGRVQGRDLGTMCFYGGMPYAKAPFGENRFQAPQPPAAWIGVRDATQFGPVPPQAPRELDDGQSLVGAEDCLTVNVLTQAQGGDKLPVLLWIPGNGFMGGGAADEIYNGAQFVRHGIVFVSINYRMGIDGFMQFPDVLNNRGLLDQIMAIEWVLENISLFGGDPDQITVGGDSAGSASICHLLGLETLKGKLKRAVLHSPSVASQTVQEAVLTRLAVASLLDLPPSLEALREVPLAQMTQLLARLQTDARLRSEVGISARSFCPVGLVVDGDLVKAPPLEQLERSWSLPGWPVPNLLIGANAEEMNFYLVPGGEIDRVDDVRLEAFVRAAHLKGVPFKEWRQRMPEATPGELLAAIQSAYYYHGPAREIALLAARHGASAWHYNFAWRSMQAQGRMGAAHGMELPFAFDNLAAKEAVERTGPDAPQSLARIMHASWVSFVLGREPAGWPRALVDSPSTRRFS